MIRFHAVYGAFITCFWLLFILSSCNITAEITPSPTLELAVSSTITLKPDMLTQTPTPQFPTLSITATPILKPTDTSAPLPVLTIPPEQANALVLELLEENAGCQLPCWWGITPGITSWQEANAFLSQFDSSVFFVDRGDQSQFADFIIPAPTEISPLGSMNIEINVYNDIVQYVYTYLFRGAPYYQLSQLLGAYGQPDEVWIHTYDYTGPGLWFHLYVFYRRGFLAYYGTSEGETQIVGDRIRGCILSGPSFYLWSSQTNLPFLEIARIIELDELKWEKPLLSLKEATGMEIETFYEKFKETDSIPCFETPRNRWPEP